MTDQADEDTSGLNTDEAAADQAVPPPREPVDVTIVGSEFPDLASTGRHLAGLVQPVMANWTRIGIAPWSWSVGAATRQMAERLASIDQIGKSLASIETASGSPKPSLTAFTRLLETLPPTRWSEQRERQGPVRRGPGRRHTAGVGAQRGNRE